MNVSLTPELEKFVSSQVSTGRYASASEVVRAALRMLEEEHRARMGEGTDREELLAAFRAELDQRIASADRGELISGEESLQRILALSAERRKISA